jgi:hypothetical protein
MSRLEYHFPWKNWGYPYTELTDLVFVLIVKRKNSPRTGGIKGKGIMTGVFTVF